MATVDPFPDVNHLALSTTGGVCHGHYLVSGDTLSAVNTERSGEAAPPDEGGGVTRPERMVAACAKQMRDPDAEWSGMRNVLEVSCNVANCICEGNATIHLSSHPSARPRPKPDVSDIGTRRYCPTCGQGIGGT